MEQPHRNIASIGLEGRYRILGTLGEGGSGTVYHAVDLVDRREVALKILSTAAAPGRGLTAEESPKADEEFRLLASLSHPHLAEVYDFGTTERGERYFSMELLTGKDLRSFLDARKHTPGERAQDPLFREILLQILSALDFIHTRKVVHLDLKPANIVIQRLDASGEGAAEPPDRSIGRVRARLIDFGLARPFESGDSSLSGTVEYIAPERIRGAAGGAASDLYSFGAILFEAFTGHPPFRGESPQTVLRSHQEDEPSREELARIPEPFRGVTERLLRKSPSERFSTAFETAQALFGAENRLAKALPAFSASLVGREPLLERIRGRFQAVEGGRGAAFLFRGETGVGKTRLLREIRHRLQILGAPAVVASCREENGRPGEVLERIVRTLAVKEKSAAAPVLELLAESSAAEGASRSASFGDEAARERLIFKACELVFASAPATAAPIRPLAVLVDDVQWADTLDLQFLASLLRRPAPETDRPVFLCLAARSERPEDERSAGEIEAAGRAGLSIESVKIEGFSEGEIRSYLAVILGGPEAFPDDFPTTLQRDTGGNPFFIEESLKLLAERGGLVREGSRWRIAPGVGVETPGSIQEAIQRRLLRIRGLSREILQWAALLDEPFLAEEMQSWLSVRTAGGAGPETHVPTQSALEQALGELFLAQLLQREGSRYALIHRQVGAVVLESIAGETRRERHRRIGERLLEEGDLLSGRRLERAAHHLFRSDHPERALEHLVRAGERAQRSGALREAARNFGRALEVVRDPSERARLLLQREQTWALLGDREHQLADLREAAELASRLGDPRLALEAISREAAYLDATGRKKDSLAKYGEALVLADSIGDRAARARVLCRRAMVGLLLGDFDGPLRELAEAHAIGQSAGDRPQEAECSQLLGVGHYLRGQYDAALARMEEALAIRRDMGEEHRAGALESNIGLIHFDRGDYEAAEERFRNSLRTSRSIGFRRGEAVNLVNLGLTHSEMGRYERAIDFIAASLHIRRELGDRWGEGTDLGNLGTVYMRLGRFEKAVPLLERALAAARECGNRSSEGHNDSKLGIVAMHRGDLAGAADRLRRGLETALALRVASLELLTGSSLARLALLEGDPSRAMQILDGLVRKAQDLQMASWLIECLALRASALLACGRPREAREASIEAIRRLGTFRGWMERSHEVWFIHSRVLAAFREEGAGGIGASPEGGAEGDPGEALRRSHALLEEKAAAIRDLDLRESYLENIQLHREIRQAFAAGQEAFRQDALRRARSFYEIARSINSILELEPLLDRLLDLAVETTRAEKGMVLLCDEAGRLRVKAARDMAQESIADATEICRSVISDVSRRGESILAADAAADERFRERKSIIAFQIRALMCVPLAVRGERIGAVYVDSRGAGSFQPEDLLFLSSFAHLAAIAIENARLLERLRQENLHLRKEVETRYRFENLIGTSGAMRQVFETMEKVVRTPASVLIAGETGTGKELIARALHYHGPRAERRFVAVDCGALPENLLESELFGHKRGAFSGAMHDRVGLFEEAEGGTVFLDEISNTSLDLQAKLLRVLQEGEIRRVGENHYRKVDVRVIAASNRNIEDEIAAGKFRQDLFYRLNVVPLRVPPLRERREDIPAMAEHFLHAAAERLGRKVGGFTEQAMALLVRAPWPGNVRQLQHTVEKALILGDRDRIGVETLGELSGAASRGMPGKLPAESDRGPVAAVDFSDLSLAEFDARWLEMEEAYLRQLVARAGGNFSRAARIARVRNRNTLIARLKRHGIER